MEQNTAVRKESQPPRPGWIDHRSRGVPSQFLNSIFQTASPTSALKINMCPNTRNKNRATVLIVARIVDMLDIH